MSVENKRMQQRFGTFLEYEENKNKLLPNEFASVISGDPYASDGTGLYFRFGLKEPKRLVTKDEVEEILAKVLNSGTVSGRSTLRMQGSVLSSITGSNNHVY